MNVRGKLPKMTNLSDMLPEKINASNDGETKNANKPDYHSLT